MSAALKNSILAVARSHHVLSLATQRVEEGPWAAALFYVVDSEINLYFLSHPATRHCQQMALDPRVAATINDSPAAWASIHGLQVEGRAAAVEPARRDTVQALYFARFPNVRTVVSDPRTADERLIAERFMAARFYEVVPRRIRLIDNRRGFGHQEELRLGS